MFHRRSSPLTILDAFDVPRMTVNCTQRRTSTVSSQALLMLNSEEVLTQADRMADRLENEAGAAVASASTWPTDCPLRGAPTRLRSQRLSRFSPSRAARIRRNQAHLPRRVTPPATPTPEHRALADFCQVLLNSPEFLYVD